MHNKSIKKVYITDTIQYTEINLFKIPCKSIEDNLIDAVYNLNDMLHMNKLSKSYHNDAHQQAIDTLKEMLLLKNNCPPPRVINELLLPPKVTPNEPSNLTK